MALGWKKKRDHTQIKTLECCLLCIVTSTMHNMMNKYLHLNVIICDKAGILVAIHF